MILKRVAAAGLKTFFYRSHSPETASSSEKQRFLDFASFLSRLGPHPSIPAVLGVVSVQPPLALVVEELKHRDLLGFLWECRQVDTNLVLITRIDQTAEQGAFFSFLQLGKLIPPRLNV